MPDEISAPTYSLAELCDLADVTPRTVRYYVQQGLLRSPDVAGPQTRYEEGHLWRLRSIRQLQREHLPLAEIRKRLAALSDAEVQDLVAGRPGAVRDSAVDYIRDVLGSRGVTPAVPSPAARAFALPAPAPQASMPRVAAMRAPGSAFELAGSPADAASTAPSAAGPIPQPLRSPPPPPSTVTPDRSQWDRVALTQDVELHIRRPLGRDANRRVDRLISIARQLLEEDTP